MEMNEITSKSDRSSAHVSFHDEPRVQAVTIQEDPSSLASGQGASLIEDRAGKCQKE